MRRCVPNVIAECWRESQTNQPDATWVALSSDTVPVAEIPCHTVFCAPINEITWAARRRLANVRKTGIPARAGGWNFLKSGNCDD